MPCVLLVQCFIIADGTEKDLSYDLEFYDAFIIISLFLRSVLRQMRRNRDEETELMKNVEGWEVGTYYGEPIYFLDEENQFREPLYIEHFAHADPSKVADRTCRHLMT